MLPRTLTHHICTLSTFNLNHAINGYIRNGNLKNARQLFDRNPNSRNVVSWNSIISGYIRQNDMEQAQYLFNQMPQRDVISWNTILSGFRDANDPARLHRCFSEMRKLGERPNELTFAIIVSGILNTEFNVLIPQLHCLVFCLGLNMNAVLGSALMRGYIDLGNCEGLCKAFDEILVKDVTPSNVLILGYMEFGFTREARRVFDAMPGKSAFSWSSLINGYLKNNKLREARSAFHEMSEKDVDVVSWTAMIKGYVQFGEFVDALELFVLMMKSSGIRPNHYTFSSALDACAGCSSLLVGNQVHNCIFKFGTPLDVILSTSLVDMYAKCGDIEAAFGVFQSMQNKNVASWNAIIGGYARHGLAVRGMEEFQRMTKTGIKPDEITFINVLSGCVHGGMVEEGERLFNSMEVKYGVGAEMEHYACMVDLYGRAGQLEKAEKLIKTMPYEADVVVWGALLGACGLHSSLELGEIAANGIYKLQEDHPAAYELLSKIHGEKGVWSGVIELKQLMKKKCAKKQKAGSWIDAGGVS